MGQIDGLARMKADHFASDVFRIYGEMHYSYWLSYDRKTTCTNMRDFCIAYRIQNTEYILCSSSTFRGFRRTYKALGLSWMKRLGNCTMLLVLVLSEDSAYCIQYIVYCIQYTVYCIQYFVYCIQYIVYCIQYIVFSLYVFSILCSLLV